MTRDKAHRILRQHLDEWFPTLVHYGGIVLLVYAVAWDRGEHLAYITAASGMILYRYVAGGRNGGDK